MIEVKNLHKKYDQTQVLNGLNLTVKTGSVLGLIGVNGSGKSTLLRVMAGVMFADSGEVLYNGENVYENEKAKKDLFFLPDDPYYTSNITGEKMREMYKAFYSFDDVVFNSYIGTFKLDLKKPVRNFSKGMKRQLFICFAFAIKPKFLLLDEVFDGLDPFARQIFKRGLIELNEQNNCTTIIASHSLRELEDICDSFAIIDNNIIINSGDMINSLDTVYKFQIVFDKPVQKELFAFKCLSIEVSGRIVTIICKGDKDFYLNSIKSLNPVLIDEVAVNFEEMFISEIKNKEKM